MTKADKGTESENFVSLNSLVMALYDSDSTRGGERFCYILGSGASATSGIKTGVEFAKVWVEDLKKSGEVCDLDPTNSEDYFKIFNKRFELFPKLGQQFLRKEMKNAEPSFGYYPLSQQISGKWNNIAITTNFDKLIEEALHIYSSEKPLVIDNEKLTDLYDQNMEDPVIIQIHRGLFNSINTTDDVQELAQEWKTLLDQILSRYIPVVIGYGGGDKTLMTYLETAKFPNNIYWCYRQGRDKDESLEKVKKITVKVDNVRLVAVENDDAFDFIMSKINEAFEYPQPEDRIAERADKWTNIITEQFYKLNEYMMLSESEIGRRIKYLDEKTTENPNDATLFFNRGFTYLVKGEYDKAIEDYSKTIELKSDIVDAYTCRGWAYDDKGEHDKAIMDYSDAIRLAPCAFLYYNFRGTAYDKKGEYDKAIVDYSDAIRLYLDYAEAFYNRGLAYKNLGKSTLAEDDFAKAKELGYKEGQA